MFLNYFIFECYSFSKILIFNSELFVIGVCILFLFGIYLFLNQFFYNQYYNGLFSFFFIIFTISILIVKCIKQCSVKQLMLFAFEKTQIKQFNKILQRNYFIISSIFGTSYIPTPERISWSYLNYIEKIMIEWVKMKKLVVLGTAVCWN